MTTEPIETETDDEAFYCECGAVMTDDEIENNPGAQCDKCHAASHFTCSECDDEHELSDAHSTKKGMCESCGDDAIETERTEALDAAKEELQELVDELVGNDDIDAITAAVKALKRLQPK
jgi:hypothetical protein